MSPPAMLALENLWVAYGAGRQAVKNVSFAVAPGEFFTLLGPSGCGKTTTLRSIAGLETPTGGAIRINGEPVFSAAQDLNRPPQSRDIAMVFQSYAVWPHMTVFENVAFPLEAKGIGRPRQRSVVAEVLRMVGLADHADRSATQLSGGEQQRVAVARALAKGAKILLLDEPLSNLDAKLRDQMRRELRELQQRVGTTAIYVTHDQEEALSLSDRIAVMENGQIVEIGTPLELYFRPRRLFTARFIGQAELVECEVLRVSGITARIRTGLGDLDAGIGGAAADEATHLLVRPESVIFVAGPGPNVLAATITKAIFSGKMIEYEAATASGRRLSIHSAAGPIRPPGSSVHLHLPPERCVLVSNRATDSQH